MNKSVNCVNPLNKFRCDECEKEFETKNGLKRHMRTKHGAAKQKAGKKRGKADIPHLIECDACD